MIYCESGAWILSNQMLWTSWEQTIIGFKVCTINKHNICENNKHKSVARVPKFKENICLLIESFFWVFFFYWPPWYTVFVISVIFSVKSTKIWVQYKWINHRINILESFETQPMHKPLRKFTNTYIDYQIAL